MVPIAVGAAAHGGGGTAEASHSGGMATDIRAALGGPQGSTRGNSVARSVFYEQEAKRMSSIRVVAWFTWFAHGIGSCRRLCYQENEFAKGVIRHEKICFVSVCLFAVGLFAAFPRPAAAQDQDPPGRVARLNYIQGSVSYQVSGDQDWVQADPNRPLTTGDNLWADKDSRGEVHIGSTAIRMSSETGISFLTLDDRTAQLQLAQGTIEVHLGFYERRCLRNRHAQPRASPLTRAGEYRIETDPNGGSTVIVVREGAGEVTGGGDHWDLGPDSNTHSKARTSSPTTPAGVPASTISRIGASRAISVRTAPSPRNTFRAMSTATTTSTNTATGNRIPTTAQFGCRAALLSDGRLTRWATGFSSRRGDGPGLIPSRGDWRRFTTAAGPSSAIAGAGCRAGCRSSGVCARGCRIRGRRRIRFLRRFRRRNLLASDGFRSGRVTFSFRDTAEPALLSKYQCDEHADRERHGGAQRLQHGRGQSRLTHVNYMYANNERAITAVSRDTFVNARPVAGGMVHVNADQIRTRARSRFGSDRSDSHELRVGDGPRRDGQAVVLLCAAPGCRAANPAVETQRRTPEFTNDSKPFNQPPRVNNNPPPANNQTNKQQQSNNGFRPFTPPGSNNRTTTQPDNRNASSQVNRTQPPQNEERPAMKFTQPTKARDEMYDVHPPLNKPKTESKPPHIPHRRPIRKSTRRKNSGCETADGFGK